MIDTKFLNQIFDVKIDRAVLPSDFAEENREVPQGEPMPGRWSYDNSPLTREIVDCLHPDSPYKYIGVMKSAQCGVSQGVIYNGTCYVMKHAPAPILLTAGDESLCNKAMGERIPSVIKEFNLDDLIRPNIERKGKAKSSGDTLKVKQFSGGSITAQSIQALNKMRQSTFMIGFLDDYESAVLTNESLDGDVFEVVKGRFTRYAERMKIFLISTPTLKEGSKILPAYEAGDQRKWHVQCPCCNEWITLEFHITNETPEYGIIYDVDERGEVDTDTVRYKCQRCGGEFEEHKKKEIIRSGKWIPTAKPKNEFYRSYHISEIYSVFGTSWVDLAEMRHDAYNDPAKLKAFLTIRLGLPYEEKKQTVKIKTIAKNTRDYKIGTIPNNLSNRDGNGDIKLLTIACDLAGHLGEDETEDDVRLDYEILAHAESGSTYSIDAGSIGTYSGRKNSRNDRKKYTYKHGFHNSVWNELQEIIQKSYPDEDGVSYEIQLCVIDSGYATDEVYTFLEQNAGLAFGIKEKGEDKITSVDANDKAFISSKTRPRDCFIIQTHFKKDALAEYVKKRAERQPQEKNTMNFPTPERGRYTAKNYFAHYEGEAKKPIHNSKGEKIGYKWNKKHSGSDDHFKDCRVYNMIARDIYVKLWAQTMRQRGVKISAPDAFTWQEFVMY